MCSRVRPIAFGLLVSLVVASAVAVRAVTTWASSEALGDVAVSFDNEVHVFHLADPGGDDTLPLAGTNAGLAFDASLDLLVTNTDFSGNGRIVKFAPTAPHGQLGAISVGAGVSPRSLALAADGTVYVASLGGTIRRYTAAGALSRTFSVTPESTACIGIDLSPDQDTLYVVTGGRTILRLAGVSGHGPIASTALPSLPNPGTACGLRLLPPLDVRSTPTPPSPTPIVSGFLVADSRNIKRLDAFGAIVETFNAGTEPEAQKNWLDVALDPDTQDFWAVDAGQWRLAKFRIAGTSNPLSLTQLSGMPRGVAVNGELRAAQSVQLVNLTAGVEGTATFLQNSPYQHAWKGTLSVSRQFAIQAIEAVQVADTVAPPCPVSLNVDCRLTLFPAATAKTYSRGRSVFYREILRESPVPADADIRIGVIYPNGATDTDPGSTCVVGVTPKAGTALLRDPWPHDLFAIDNTVAFYGGDDGVYTKTRVFNDNIVVDRGDARYNMLIVKPDAGTTAQLGRSLPVALDVRDPQSLCSFVSGLEGALVLSVVDITVVNNVPLDTIVGDSRGIHGFLGANGVSWATQNSLYRTNLPLDSKFTRNHSYRMCVTAAAGATIDGMPAGGEVCRDFSVK